MKTNGNTILITGGATGIGFSLASAFIEAGNRVLICGRREGKLREAKSRLPQLETMVCDVTNAGDRQVLLRRATTQFPDLNILVNNAGIQRQIDFTKGPQALSDGENEIAPNLEAQTRLWKNFRAEECPV